VGLASLASPWLRQVHRNFLFVFVLGNSAAHNVYGQACSFLVVQAGAEVCLTDLPHITPLTRENSERNSALVECRATVTDYKWNDDISRLPFLPDVVIAAGAAGMTWLLF
jgi:hypothetical protein